MSLTYHLAFGIIQLSGIPVPIPNTASRLGKHNKRCCYIDLSLAGRSVFSEGKMVDYKKIIVIGCSGGGKSTFSKQLAEITGLPLYNLDRIYWLPDASHLERPEFIKRQKEIMRGDEWIIDGNYRGTLKYRMKKCELCYFFDMPPEICIKGVLNRDINREDIACRLEPDEELINDIKTYAEVARPKVLKLFEKYSNVKTVTFKSHKAVDDYLDKLRREYGLNV